MSIATVAADPIAEARRYLTAALKGLDAIAAQDFTDESIGLDRREALISTAHYASLAVTELLEAE